MREGFEKIAFAKIAETAAAHRSLNQVRCKDRGARNSGFLQQCSAAIEKPYRQERASPLEGRSRGIHSMKGIV